MNVRYYWAEIYQRLAADYYRLSTQDIKLIGHGKAAIYQRLADGEYRMARILMGLEDAE